jgi:glucose-6-phosphate 1-epimerase
MSFAIYIDKADGFQRKLPRIPPLRISAENDQVYLDTTATCTVEDPVWNGRLAVSETGCHSTVIWNPWMNRTATTTDIEPDRWKEMICVESANVAGKPVRLAPGESPGMAVLISVE